MCLLVSLLPILSPASSWMSCKVAMYCQLIDPDCDLMMP